MRTVVEVVVVVVLPHIEVVVEVLVGRFVAERVDRWVVVAERVDKLVVVAGRVGKWAAAQADEGLQMAGA